MKQRPKIINENIKLLKTLIKMEKLDILLTREYMNKFIEILARKPKEGEKIWIKIKNLLKKVREK